MGDGRRVQRVEKELQNLVANFLVKGFRYPLRGLVSVSRVETNEKLRTAKIYVSVMGSEEDTEYSMEMLHDHIGDIQRHVSSKLSMKFTPRLSVALDLGMKHMMHVGSVLKEIERDDSKRQPLSDDEPED